MKTIQPHRFALSSLMIARLARKYSRNEIMVADWVGLFLGFAFVLVSGSSFGQTTIQGHVLRHDTNTSIAFANIGISNSDVGTLSNEDGTFSILVPPKHASDSLTFSALGFEKKTVAVRALKDAENVIHLREKPIELKPVIVSFRRESAKIYKLGNDRFNGGVIETDTTYAGRSIALLIDNQGPDFRRDFGFPVYLEKARLRILRNNLKSFRFRIRVNAVDALLGTPGDDLLRESIVVESGIRNGWLDFDLSHLNFIVDKPFFVTFEQLTDVGDRTAIADGYREFIRKYPEKFVIDTVVFDGKKIPYERLKGSAAIDLPGTFIAISTKVPEYACYVRQSSMGKWEKVRGVVAATVVLSSQPEPTKE